MRSEKILPGVRPSSLHLMVSYVLFHLIAWRIEKSKHFSVGLFMLIFLFHNFMFNVSPDFSKYSHIKLCVNFFQRCWNDHLIVCSHVFHKTDAI